MKEFRVAFAAAAVLLTAFGAGCADGDPIHGGEPVDEGAAALKLDPNLSLIVTGARDSVALSRFTR